MLRQATNPNFSRKNWSERKSRIYSFVRCGLIEYSNHALVQMEARDISKEQVESCLTSYGTSIVQCHDKGTYNNNEDELVVLHGKTKLNGKTKPIHIVLAEHLSLIGGRTYVVITAYYSSKEYFYANGKALRNKMVS